MNITRIPATVACRSLVGVGIAHWPHRPLDFGNYFHFSLGPNHWPENYCVNMWAENLTAWAKGTGAQDIEVAIFDNGATWQSPTGETWQEPTFAYVTDERIPREWLISQGNYAEDGHPGIVLTGCMWCPKETRDEIMAFHQDRLDRVKDAPAKDASRGAAAYLADG